EEALFPSGWEQALNRNLSFVVNRMDERVIAGQNIETLLAVLMFVMMGITLERSRIAEDLLTTMARVFGPLPGGLAVSIVVVGAFLAASTGIVGATVVTMGLLALPTMLKNGYAPELATGVIAASGTLGQIIPPSIVIVLLGTLAGDMYATGQETRAQLAGCTDALTFLGKPAVLSVGTLFQAALLPGIMLAFLYAAYAFGYATLNPAKAPPVQMDAANSEAITPGEALTWFLILPGALIALTLALGQAGVIGSQDLSVSGVTQDGQLAELRTNVSPECQASMIALHGQEKWDRAVAQTAAQTEASGTGAVRERTAEELEAAQAEKLAQAAPVGTGVATLVLLFALALITARGVAPSQPVMPLGIGGVGLALAIGADVFLISPVSGPGWTFSVLALPFALVFYSCRHAVARLARNDLIRVVFPPLILIVAVLGSILAGVTNPTPAAALGAGGAIMLAAYRKLREEEGNAKIILASAFAVVIMIVIGMNFDLRTGREIISTADWIAIGVAQVAYHLAMIGLVFACWVLWRRSILAPVVRETAKVTSMVFTILIGSQILNLVVISFGGEHYIQQFLRAFDNEIVVFLIVMAVLFILGFVLDFLEIIYIVIPIVGPVIYGGTLDPAWVTIMIAINLQTSFLTPPFGFALFYLRGVAPREVTTGHIYRGVVPFVLIQVTALGLLWLVPGVVTLVPDLLAR
ncbi:MAG: TRAP transporter large permease subunit, partial [Pseudomonadota bacterium]